jgi:hypothetical protein
MPSEMRLFIQAHFFALAKMARRASTAQKFYKMHIIGV